MNDIAEAGRSAGEVFRNHLALRLAGCTEEDISRNYAEDVVMLVVDGAKRGRQAVREGARQLAKELPNARFEILTEIVEGSYAFLLWRAEADGCEAVDGADSFVIRDGQIVMQSVFYRLRPAAPRTSAVSSRTAAAAAGERSTFVGRSAG